MDSHGIDWRWFIGVLGSCILALAAAIAYAGKLVAAGVRIITEIRAELKATKEDTGRIAGTVAKHDTSLDDHHERVIRLEEHAKRSGFRPAHHDAE